MQVTSLLHFVRFEIPAQSAPSCSGRAGCCMVSRSAVHSSVGAWLGMAVGCSLGSSVDGVSKQSQNSKYESAQSFAKHSQWVVLKVVLLAAGWAALMAAPWDVR